MNRPAVRVLVVLASIAAVLALVVGYVQRAFIDSDQFSNRATAVLRDDNVRGLIADRITDQLILARHSQLTTVRPLISSVVSSAIGGQAFQRVFRAGVRDVHRAVFARDESTVTLTVADVGTLAAAGLEVLRPSAAAQVRGAKRVELLKRDFGGVSASAVRIADRIRVLALLFLVLAFGLTAVAVWIAADRRRAVLELGIGLACAGILLVIAMDIAQPLATGGIERPEARAAARAVWDAFLGDLHTAAWLLAGTGAVVAAAAASLIRPVELGGPVRRAARAIAREPARPALRVLRGILIALAGIAILLDHARFVDLVVTVVGVYLVYEGLTALLRMIYRPEPAAERAPRRSRRGVAVAGVALLAVLGAAAAFVGTGGVTQAAPAAGPCLGHDELCDRPFNEVALAATHNSMSAPLPGWFSSQQDAPIPAQLADGIRGLLIDTHYADRLVNGRLRTVLDERALRAEAQTDGVSPAAVAAALRIRERLGFKGPGKRGMYLCHTFCELGGTPLQDGLLLPLHDFLVAHPDEIVVVINQDYVTPQDFVDAVRAAGLEQLAYRGPTTGRWPTVRQMIDSNQRVVFLAEDKAGAAPWYHLAYDSITMETPFHFRSTTELTDPAKQPASCRPNRGPASGAPMFLVNHWITTDPAPQPANAATVNALRPLLERLRTCRRVRGHIPNLVAVDFYRRGDVFGAVDALNGVR